MPVASQTAWQGLFTHGHLEKGQTVIATASGNDEAYLNSIGARRVIDYRQAQFEKALREKRDREVPCVWRDDEARAVSGRARQNRATAGSARSCFAW